MQYTVLASVHETAGQSHAWGLDGENELSIVHNAPKYTYSLPSALQSNHMIRLRRKGHLSSSVYVQGFWEEMLRKLQGADSRIGGFIRSQIIALLIGSFGLMASAQDFEAGESAFSSNCASCHGQSGEGLQGAFPPLVPQVHDLLESEGGQGAEYLAAVLVNGLEGAITVDDQKYDGVMPAWSQLSDNVIVDILHYLNVLGEEAQANSGEQSPLLVDSDLLVKARESPIAPADVLSMREQLQYYQPVTSSVDDDQDTPDENAVVGEGEQEEGDDTKAAEQSSGLLASQVNSGGNLFRNNCASCHGDDLLGHIDGPELKGDYFMSYWGDKNILELYGYAKNNMPPANPGGLEDNQYMDIVVFILSQNGFSENGNHAWQSSDSNLQNILIGEGASE